MKNKKLITVAMAVAASMLMTGTAMAGSWQKNENGWWYDNGNGTWPANTWQWIDGNGDGIAESYHFDKNGYLSVNTTIDGYPVNADGAWTVNGAVQTQATNPAPAQQASDELTEAERQSLRNQMLRIINRDPEEDGIADTHNGLMDVAQNFAEELSSQNWYQGVEGIWTTNELKEKYKWNGLEDSNEDLCDMGGYINIELTTGRTTGSPQDMWNEWTRINKYFRLTRLGDTSVNNPRYAPLSFGDLNIGIGVERKNGAYYWVILTSYGEPILKADYERMFGVKLKD